MAVKSSLTYLVFWQNNTMSKKISKKAVFLTQQCTPPFGGVLKNRL